MVRLKFYLSMLMIYVGISFSTSFEMFFWLVFGGLFLYIWSLFEIKQNKHYSIIFLTLCFFTASTIDDLLGGDNLELILLPYLLLSAIAFYKEEPRTKLKPILDYKNPFIIHGKPDSLFDYVAMLTKGQLTSGKAIIYPSRNFGYHNVCYAKNMFQLLNRKKYVKFEPFYIDKSTIIRLIEKGHYIEPAKMSYAEASKLSNKYGVNCKELY